jgi:hypothetical protein
MLDIDHLSIAFVSNLGTNPEFTADRCYNPIPSRACPAQRAGTHEHHACKIRHAAQKVLLSAYIKNPIAEAGAVPIPHIVRELPTTTRSRALYVCIHNGIRSIQRQD